GALAAMRATPFAADDYAPHPVPVLDCVANSPDVQCENMLNDATAAYTQALLWFYTRHDKYARKAIQILDAWSETQIGQSGATGPMYSAWGAEMFPRAAE